MKPFRSAFLAAIAAVATLPALADTQTVDRIGKPAKIRCNVWTDGTPIFAEHADKIVFRLTGALQAANPVDQVALDQIVRNSKLDIKVIDDPTTIADLKGKVLTFIGAVDNAVSRNSLLIDEVLYAMVCPVRPGAVQP